MLNIAATDAASAQIEAALDQAIAGEHRSQKNKARDQYRHPKEKPGTLLKPAARSEINANSKDTKDHPTGVWTLPPSLRLGDSDCEKVFRDRRKRPHDAQICEAVVAPRSVP